MNEKLSISEENIDLIRNLAMYSDDDLEFFKQITKYLYRLGHSMENRKNEIESQETLHRLCELIIFLNKIFDNEVKEYAKNYKEE